MQKLLSDSNKRGLILTLALFVLVCLPQDFHEPQSSLQRVISGDDKDLTQSKTTD